MLHNFSHYKVTPPLEFPNFWTTFFAPSVIFFSVALVYITLEMLF